jgi:hypothetical protein
MRISRGVSRRSERGQIIIFTLIAVVFLLVIAGSLASDVAKMIALKNEIQSSLDAAALGGAGKLGFDSSVFPTVRDFAVNFAAANKTRNGTVTLTRNDANDTAAFNTAAMPYGDVLLGVWDPSLPDGIGDGKRFKPSLDGTVVNSVMCRYKRQTPANFMSLWGLFQMNVAASAVATANPPATVPPDACLFPIAVGDCPFQGNTSLGCGATITFITSSGKGDAGAGCLAPPCTNTAAWASLDPSKDPNTPNIQQQINNANGGVCTGSPLQTGNTVAVNNGMAQPIMDTLQTDFVQQFNASETVTVTDSNGTATYTGKGWKVYIPVIHSTSCPAGPLTGSPTIVGWTEFVMTQVINKGNCAVANHNPTNNQWDHIGAAGNCIGDQAPKNANALRAVFGYYSCKIIPTNPVPTPVPRSALATKLRLVR